MKLLSNVDRMYAALICGLIANIPQLFSI